MRDQFTGYLKLGDQMIFLTRTVMFVVLIGVSFHLKASEMWAYFVTPDERQATFQFEGGEVIADSQTQNFYLAFDSGEVYEFSFIQVALNESPMPNALIAELISSIEDPEAGRSYHSHIPNENWGVVPGSRPGPVPGDLIIQSNGGYFKDSARNPMQCSLPFGLCDNPCAPYGCSPFLGFFGSGLGVSFLADGGPSTLFGDTPAERECAARHYRQWLDSQSGICDSAVRNNLLAIGAGAVAFSACRSAANLPNLNSALACAGSYLGLLVTSWHGANLTARCQRTYPGPGASC